MKIREDIEKTLAPEKKLLNKSKRVINIEMTDFFNNLVRFSNSMDAAALESLNNRQRNENTR